MKEKVCLICGDTFIPTSGRQKCCNKPVTRICVVCGKEFQSKCTQYPLTTCEDPKCKYATSHNHTNIFLQERKCKECGEIFKPRGTTQVYCNQPKHKQCPICGRDMEYICNGQSNQTCSPECQAQLVLQKRAESASNEIRICKWCGKEFHPKEWQDIYCSGPHFKKCVICGKEFEIDVRSYSKTETCSKECMGKLMSQNHDYEKGYETQKQNLLAKYGVTNAMHIPGVIDKLKQTNMNKYGSEWYTQTAEYKERVKETDLKKYGVEHHFQSNVVKTKRMETFLRKYGTDNVFKASIIKAKLRETNLRKYGVEHPMKNKIIRAKAVRNARTSTLEKRICNLLDNYQISYIHHYVLSDNNLVHEYDFYLPEYKLLVDADGLYYHAYLDDPDGVRVRDDYDSVRLALVPSDHVFHVIVEGNEDAQMKELIETLESAGGDLKTYDSYLFDWCRQVGFPYPNYTEDRLRRDWAHLSRYQNDAYIPQCRIGISIVKQFHKSIYDARVGTSISPHEAWFDDKLLKEVIRNRYIYKNEVDPSKVLSGFNISKTCPCVSIFNPVLARYLTNKYLAEFNEVFDPFSGFSGRLLGVTSLGKRYIGQDLNQTAVSESNQIIEFLSLHNLATVTNKDILESSGQFECLLTCPPYNKKEIYANEQEFKTCDEWIDECLFRFDCKRYVFVVDKTDKYQDKVVETLTNNYHFSSSTEQVVIIDRI